MTQPRDATTDKGGNRFYTWRDERFVSSTTVIKGGLPEGWGLKKWRSTTVAKYCLDNAEKLAGLTEREALNLALDEPFAVRDAAANRGSEVHRFAEARVLGQDIGEPPPEIAPYVAQFVRFIEDWVETFECAEATVYNRQWGYAGTLDWIAELKHYGMALGDTKTKPKGKTVFGEVGLQLASYRFAEFIGMRDGSEVPVPEVDGCVVLVVHPESYELRPVTADENAFRWFLYCKEVREFAEEHSKNMVGGLLKPPSSRPVLPPNVTALVD